MKRTSPKKRKSGEAGAPIYLFRLFVAGEESNSLMARENLTRISEAHLNGCAKIEIVDVLDDFQTALENNVLVTPTLIMVAPPPKVTILGNLNDVKKVLCALRLSGGES